MGLETFWNLPKGMGGDKSLPTPAYRGPSSQTPQGTVITGCRLGPRVSDRNASLGVNQGPTHAPEVEMVLGRDGGSLGNLCWVGGEVMGSGGSGLLRAPPQRRLG